MGSCSSTTAASTAVPNKIVVAPTSVQKEPANADTDEEEYKEVKLTPLNQLIEDARRYRVDACESLSKVYTEGSRKFGVKKHLSLAKFYTLLAKACVNDDDKNDQKFDAIIGLLHSEKNPRKASKTTKTNKRHKVDQEVVKLAILHLCKLAVKGLHPKSFQHLIDLYAANSDYYVEDADKCLVKVDILESLYWARYAVRRNIAGGYAELFLGRYFAGGNTIDFIGGNADGVLSLKLVEENALKFFTMSAAKGNVSAKDELRHLLYCRRNDPTGTDGNNSQPVTTDVILTAGDGEYKAHTLIKMDKCCDRPSIPISKDFAHFKHHAHLPLCTEQQRFDYFRADLPPFSRQEHNSAILDLFWKTENPNFAGLIIDHLCWRFHFANCLAEAESAAGGIGARYLLVNILRRSKSMQQDVVRHLLWAGISHVELLKCFITSLTVLNTTATTSTSTNSVPNAQAIADTECIDFILREYRLLQPLASVFDSRRNESSKDFLLQTIGDTSETISDIYNLKLIVPTELLNLIGDYFPWLHYRRVRKNIRLKSLRYH